MSIKSHLDALNDKHATLEEELHNAYTHHLPTAFIKKEKLKVKDEILNFEARMRMPHKQAA